MSLSVSSRLLAAAALLAVGGGCAQPGGPTEPSAGCDVPAVWSVPEQVGELWRCELRGAGVAEAEVVRIAAEAVALSHCESAWNASALAYAGQFASTAHPLTGRVHTEAGVFQLSASDAEMFVPGGRAAVLDARANITGAARLFLSRYHGGGSLAGFSPWPCAAQVIPGFPGAPDQLPSWALLY